MKCRRIFFLISLVIPFFFSGCATLLSGSYYQKINSDYNIDRQATIVVTVNKDDMDSKYYVNHVVEKLKSNGFANVYSYKDANLPVIQNILIISVSEKFDSYQYNSADYGTVNSGTSTTNCYGYGNYANCTTTQNKTVGVTGYSQKTGYIHGHYFTMHLYDMASKEKILFAMSSTYEENCNSDKLYQFLIIETVNRMNFQKPMDYKFTVKMPDGFTCK